MSGHRVIGQLPAANGDVTFSRAELYLEGSQRCCRVITVREKHDLEWRCARVNLARFDFRAFTDLREVGLKKRLPLAHAPTMMRVGSTQTHFLEKTFQFSVEL